VPKRLARRGREDAAVRHDRKVRTIGSIVERDLFLIISVATIAFVVLFVLLSRRQRRSVGMRRSATFRTAEAAQTKPQVAAVPVRIGTTGGIEILVISTRGSGRWTVPKGGPMRGRSDAEAAAQEAYEEAGVRGCVVPEPIGTFAYTKRRNEREMLLVTVYRLDVTHQVRHWRERGQRKQRWLSAAAAADRVAWAGLGKIIRSLEATPAAERD
jgi:8-oxo-dGTP pyrophosphatase MutT (NUDIX family)